MPRVKGAVHALKNRRKTLKRTKGYRHGRKSKERMANEAIVHAGSYAFAHRKDRKADFRRLWTVKINAALKEHNLSYSAFINLLNKKNIEINRKMLATLAATYPKSFKQIVEEARS